MQNLRRPLFLAALVVLALNDHVLKGAGTVPTWVTGKASDVAGMLVAPVLLAWCLRVRSQHAFWACHAAVAVVFAALKLFVPVALAWDALFAVCGVAARTTVDPTDLLALPVLLWSAATFRVEKGGAGTPSTFGVAVLALGVCAGSSRHPNLTQNAKAPSARYVELGSLPIKSESGAIGFSARPLDASHSCADVMANPGSLHPSFFASPGGSGLVEEFSQPIENGEVREIEGRECGALLVHAETAEWFGSSRFELPPTYVLWDRRAVLQARTQGGATAEIGLLVLKKQHGQLTLVTTSPLVKLIPVPKLDAQRALQPAPLPPTAPPSVDAIVGQAISRLDPCGGGGSKPCAILLQTSLGHRAAEATDRLRQELAKNPRFLWTTATKQEEGPVPDGAQPGGHVHAVSWHFDPPPHLLLLVREVDGKLVLAARLPGSDPYGPPQDGWLWTVREP